MKASLQNAVSLFNAPLAQTARVLEALRQKVEAEAPAVEAPAAEAAEAPATEAADAAEATEQNEG
nr:hypothetical protein [Jiangella alkaliphila]